MVDESKELAVAGADVPAVIGAEEYGEESCASGVSTADIFSNLIMQSNHAAHEAEAKLQVEEKGNGVADLQGFCAGIRKFKSVAKDAGFDVPPRLFDTANRMTPWVQELDGADGDGDGDTDCNLSLDELSEFSRLLDGLCASDEYTRLRESMQNEIKAKKDFLYAEAKTSRDLFWTHGWHRGFSWVEQQIKELQYWKGVKQQQAEKRAKEKASELPFEGDED